MPASLPSFPAARPSGHRLALAGLLVGFAAAGCQTPDDGATSLETEATSDIADVADEEAVAATPPPRIQDWMDRLTVAHHYDPATGFIVADEVIDLPAVLRRAPDARTLVAFGREQSLPVVVFATANRCAPCQQFKRDALQDPEVRILLEAGDLLATHVEVDQSPEIAREVLGSLSIPMSYLIRDGVVVDRLSGQRSAAELRDWLRPGQGVIDPSPDAPRMSIGSHGGGARFISGPDTLAPGGRGRSPLRPPPEPADP